MKIYYFLFCCFIFMLFSSSCEKIIAKDISDKIPVLILPSENDTLGQSSVQFKWNELEGATRYRLQVASPDFDTPQSFPIDSLITDTDFIYSLDSAQYEVRLSATNGGYNSKSTPPVKFWVGVGGTTGGQIQLNTPLNGAYVGGSFNKLFSWSSLQGVLTYEFSLRKGSNFPSGIVVHSQNNISTSNVSVSSNISEGEYHWGVKAFLQNMETPYQTAVFYVDTTAPITPLLSIPANLSVENSGVIEFTWNNGNDQGNIQSPVHSLIEVSTNQSFANIIFSQDLIGNTVSTNLDPGTYYWRVYNYDEAQNTSQYSLINSFTLQ